MKNLRIFLISTVLCVLSVMAGCSEDDIIAGASPHKNTDSETEYNGNQYFKKSLELMRLIENKTDRLIPLAKKMPPPKNGEWRMYWGSSEEEQSPQKYVLSMPSIVTEKQSKLYIKPLGRFSDRDYRILEKIAEYLEINFQTPVVMMKRADTIFPEEAVRKNSSGDLQYSSIYITDVLLKNEMPDDAWGVIAVTPEDIYRAEGINKLYGDSLRYARRGVISLYYLKDGSTTSLSLALKGASHEATHMLSLPHCAEYRCNMNGRITLDEFRVAPLHYSPDCLCKVLFATGADINKRFIELIEFSRKNSLQEELDYFSRAHKIINDIK